MHSGLGGIVLFCKMAFLTLEHSSVAPLLLYFSANTCKKLLSAEPVRQGYLSRCWVDLMARESVGKIGVEDCLMWGWRSRRRLCVAGTAEWETSTPWSTNNLSKYIWENS